MDDNHAAASYITAAAQGSAAVIDASSESDASLSELELGGSSLSIEASSAIHLTAGQLLYGSFSVVACMLMRPTPAVHTDISA